MERQEGGDEGRGMRGSGGIFWGKPAGTYICSLGGSMIRTKRVNLPRGYMKLDAWKDAVELFAFTHRMLDSRPKMDVRLRSQILDSTQSISSNVAEGYCRRTIKEYLQYLNVALGSCGESLTRMICLAEVGVVNAEEFERFDDI